MSNNSETIREKLIARGLRVTPQRVMVFETLLSHKNHPTAEDITEVIRENNPNIAVGTIYNILDTFVEKGLITRVKTERDCMRYDAILNKHHHIYDIASDKIVDFYDDELNGIIEEYFSKKKIPQFDIYDVKLQINGKFSD